MRKFSKLSLLLAPLMVSAVGCAGTGAVANKAAQTAPSEESRAQRLLTIAEQFERDGKPQMAYVLYERVLSQNPQDQKARQGMEGLAQRGFRPAPGQMRPGALPATSPSQKEALAKNAAADTAEPTIASAEPTRKAVAAAMPSTLTVAKAQPSPDVESVAPAARETEKTTLDHALATTAKEESTVDFAHGWSAKKSSEANLVSNEEPVKPVGKEIPETTDGEWTRTRLVTLCNELPEHLIPVVEKLEDADPRQRISGLQQLAEQRDAAQTAAVAVTALLEDSDPFVAVNAAGTLRDISGDAWESVNTLTKHLHHENQEVVRLSAYLLGRMGPEAMAASSDLVQLRNSAQGVTSLHAAEALSRITPDDPESVAVLTTGLLDQDRDVRWFAAVSLGTVAPRWKQDAAAALTRALQDQEADVRAAAALSLGGLGKHGSVALNDLEQCVAHDTAEVRDAAATAIACLRN